MVFSDSLKTKNKENHLNKQKITVIVLCCFLPIYVVHGSPIMHSANQAAQLLKQDANLYRVDEKLYRSEQLRYEDKTAIAEHNIKSIVNLRFFKRKTDMKVFADNSNINLINKPLLTWKIKPRDLAEVLWEIEQQQKHGAVLVHCYHGADRTGIVIAMYRVVYQNWTLEDAKAEMQQGGFGYHSVWKNLDKLFTEETISEIKLHLEKFRQNSSLTVPIIVSAYDYDDQIYRGKAR